MQEYCRIHEDADPPLCLLEQRARFPAEGRQGRVRAVVGADAQAALVAERILGGAYQRAVPWIARLARSR